MKSEDDKLKIDGEILTDEEIDSLADITELDIAQAVDEFDEAVPEKLRGMIG